LGNPVARQAIRGNTVSHHAAGLVAAVADLDLMPEPAQMVGARQARRAGAYHQDALSGRRAGLDRPTFLDRKIAEEAIERVDRYRLIEELPIAGAFAGVVTRAPVYRRQRIIFHVFAPSVFVPAGLRQRQPRLNIHARRTGVIAGR